VAKEGIGGQSAGVEGGMRFRKLKIGRGREDVVRLGVRGEGEGGEGEKSQPSRSVDMVRSGEQ
jgi:hypothetical protein